MVLWAQSTTTDYNRAKTNFNLSPIYSALKSSNHKSPPQEKQKKNKHRQRGRKRAETATGGERDRQRVDSDTERERKERDKKGRRERKIQRRQECREILPMRY